MRVRVDGGVARLDRRGRVIIGAVQVRIEIRPAEAAAERIAARLRDAVRRRGVATLALSGGSTAPPMIAALLDDRVPWSDVTVFQVDERIAPDGHPARNAGQLAALGSVTRVVPMPVTEADVDRAASRYAAHLPERIDVVHLGLGSDGHTASWPPGRNEIRDAPSEVVALGEFNEWPRMTLTRRAVNGARCRVLLATGAAKRPMVDRWFAGDADLPVSRLRRTGTWVYLDAAAAPASSRRSSRTSG